MIAGLGAGAGAGIGTIVNAAKARGNVLYQAPPGSLTLSPILSAGRQGVVLTMRW